jgi:hypothetical protein
MAKSKSKSRSKSRSKSKITSSDKKIITEKMSNISNNLDRIKKGGLLGAIVGNIFGIAIAIMAYTWLVNLEKINCACSESWMREYIKYYLTAYIALFGISLFVNVAIYLLDMNLSEIHANPFVIIFNTIISIFNIFAIPNIIISIIFITKLKEMNCECSEDIKREVYWVYNIVLASILALSVLMLLVAFTGWSFAYFRR